MLIIFCFSEGCSTHYPVVSTERDEHIVCAGQSNFCSVVVVGFFDGKVGLMEMLMDVNKIK